MFICHKESSESTKREKGNLVTFESLILKQNGGEPWHFKVDLDSSCSIKRIKASNQLKISVGAGSN